MARWKFVLGTMLFLVVALTAILLGESPPGTGTMLVVVVCLGGSVALSVAPYLIEYEARLRLAEAQAGDHIETQLRRLTQTTEQLSNAISRSQSSEERASQALGTLEDLSEKLIAQADELAQGLARGNERETSVLRADVERLGQEREARLAEFDRRFDALTTDLTANEAAAKKSSTATTRTLEEIKERMIALASRLDESGRTARSTQGNEPARTSVRLVGPTTATSPGPDHSTAEVIEPAPMKRTPEARATRTPQDDPPAAPVSSPEETGETGRTRAEIVSPVPKSRVRSESAAARPVTTRLSARAQTMELPLTGGDEIQPASPRDLRGGNSTIVATAYIGIGNKLYVRGDGPGLSWEHGVPMQFLAIGKWGWTSPPAETPITCRIYRNDETPMLDENVVIPPGTKAEIAPRF